MEIDHTLVRQLVAHPSESLNVEIKRWIDPRTDAAKGKIVRAIFALRNRNGGHLLIGFDDKSLAPMKYELHEDVNELFHHDYIQGIVSHFASELFEIRIDFTARDGVAYPVISIPSGVTVPVVVKRDLRVEGAQNALNVGDVFFRTLAATGSPSTSKARPQDWKDIVDICFDNREADIGRFIRRQLAGSGAAQFSNAVSELSLPSLHDRAFALLEEGNNRAWIAFSGLPADRKPPTTVGAWSVALVFEPKEPAGLPTQAFLRTILGANPQLNGWPIWLDTQNFQDSTARPYVKDGGWESVISSASPGWSSHYDFMRFDPSGKIYSWRALQDDCSNKVAAGTVLDPFIVMLRVTEAIAVGLAIARALELPQEKPLGFAFEWSGLLGRKLDAWANSFETPFYTSETSHSSSVKTYTEIPLDTSALALAPYVENATKNLFVTFGGRELSRSIYENWARRALQRQ